MTKNSGELLATKFDLSRFTYGIGHDLKAPLTSIIGLLQFCREDLEDGHLNELEHNLNRALELCYLGATRVDGLLDVARTDLDAISLEAVDLHDLVTDIWRDLTSNDEGAVTFTLELGHKDPVTADKASLRTILENLLSNALRFRDEQRNVASVTIRSEVTDKRLRISISDNGSGIPEGRYGEVFQIFRNMDQRGGSGLGLALTKKHVDRCGGSIWFHSIEGEGSEFIFDLPIHEGSVP